LVDGSGTANFVSKWSDTDTLTNSLIFDNGTNVGIGTNTPSEVLEVSKTQTAPTRLQITNAQTGGSTSVRASLRVTANDRIGEFVAVNGDDVYIGAASNHTTALMSNSAGVLYATPAGNVGIGTSTPANLLHLAGASATPSLRLGSVSANFYWDIGRENVTTGDFVFNNASGGASTERMRITGAGNVGIGTTAPASTLDVVGTLAVSGAGVIGGDLRTNGSLQVGNGTVVGNKVASITPSSTTTPANIQGVWAGTGAYDLTLQTSGGNVGIGTASPASKLDVNGDISTSGDIILTGAKGIYFDSGGSKYLDDYEEGTWTPTTPTAGYTISASEGSYTKIGRQVTFRGKARFSAVNILSNSDVRFDGLPFTIATNFIGAMRDETTSGAVYGVTASSTSIFCGSYSGVTVGSARTFAINEDYVFTVTCFV
jgi:hypothetical protein